MILQADARHIPLRDGCVQCCVTSPPYFQLRDYATATWDGGDADCDHVVSYREPSKTLGFPADGGPRRIADGNTYHEAYKSFARDFCPRCGAERIDRQIGMESTLEAYVQALVGVFREVHRVCRDDATVWLNLGDSYSGSMKGWSPNGAGYGGPKQRTNNGSMGLKPLRPGSSRADGVVDGCSIRNRDGIGAVSGLKPKDLCGIPWRVAFALQADGWYLRSDIVWSKPNPMPESVTDRPTRSHEYIFLLAKSERYFYDSDAIKEQGSMASLKRLDQPSFASQNGGAKDYGDDSNRSTRKTLEHLKARVDKQRGHGRRYDGFNDRWDLMEKQEQCALMVNKRDVWNIACEPTPEAHFATFPQKLIEPCILAGSRPGDLVLDPFLGSGTTGKVCERLGRKWVGLELSADYIAIAERRTAQMGMQFGAELTQPKGSERFGG